MDHPAVLSVAPTQRMKDLPSPQLSYERDLVILPVKTRLVHPSRAVPLWHPVLLLRHLRRSRSQLRIHAISQTRQHPLSRRSLTDWSAVSSMHLPSRCKTLLAMAVPPQTPKHKLLQLLTKDLSLLSLSIRARKSLLQCQRRLLTGRRPSRRCPPSSRCRPSPRSRSRRLPSFLCYNATSSSRATAIVRLHS